MKNKSAYAVFLYIFLVVSCSVPSITLAEDSSFRMEVQINLFEKADVLSVAPQKGTCDSLTFKVKASRVFKVVNIPRDHLRIAIPYDIYWYPDTRRDFANGKKVDHGVLNVKQDTQTFYVKYDPKNNPNGAKGEYILKVKLKVNGHIIDKNLSTKLVVNANCQEQIPGDGNNPEDPGQPGGDHNPSAIDNGKKPNQGGLLPITSGDYGNKIVLSVMLMFLGLTIHLLSVLDRKNSLPD